MNFNKRKGFIMVWSRVTSVLAMVLLLFSCYVDDQEGAVKGDLGDAGDPEYETVIYKYAMTNQKTKGRVIQIVKITYEPGNPADYKNRRHKITQIEVKNPATENRSEVISMETGDGKIYSGTDGDGDKYILSANLAGRHPPDIIDVFAIDTKNGSALQGDRWDKLSEERWQKHINPSSSQPSNVPLTGDDKAELASKCFSSNASVSDDGLQFTYSRAQCQGEGREHTFKFSSNNLRGILDCLEECGSGTFQAKNGTKMVLDCRGRNVLFEYEQNGLKTTVIDDDGLTDVIYSNDC